MTGCVIELDLRGLKCPMPVLRTRKALRRLAGGDVIILSCTDPLAVIDIPHFVRSEGHRLDGQAEAGGILSFRITKGAEGASPSAQEAARP